MRKLNITKKLINYRPNITGKSGNKLRKTPDGYYTNSCWVVLASLAVCPYSHDDALALGTDLMAKDSSSMLEMTFSHIELDNFPEAGEDEVAVFNCGNAMVRIYRPYAEAFGKAFGL